MDLVFVQTLVLCCCSIGYSSWGANCRIHSLDGIIERLNVKLLNVASSHCMGCCASSLLRVWVSNCRIHSLDGSLYIEWMIGECQSIVHCASSGWSLCVATSSHRMPSASSLDDIACLRVLTRWWVVITLRPPPLVIVEWIVVVVAPSSSHLTVTQFVSHVTGNTWQQMIPTNNGVRVRIIVVQYCCDLASAFCPHKSARWLVWFDG